MSRSERESGYGERRAWSSEQGEEESRRQYSQASFFASEGGGECRRVVAPSDKHRCA